MPNFTGQPIDSENRESLEMAQERAYLQRDADDYYSLSNGIGNVRDTFLYGIGLMRASRMSQDGPARVGGTILGEVEKIARFALKPFDVNTISNQEAIHRLSELEKMGYGVRSGWERLPKDLKAKYLLAISKDVTKQLLGIKRMDEQFGIRYDQDRDAPDFSVNKNWD